MNFEVSKYYTDSDEEDFMNELMQDFDINSNLDLSDMQEKCFGIFEERTRVFNKDNLVLETVSYKNKTYYFLEDLQTEILYKIVIDCKN